MRRLKIGMRLQTDPTVIYGIGAAYDGNIRRRDLTTDTPYNTYTRAGLTPTPIAMPSRDALMAAARRPPVMRVLRCRGRRQRRARVLAQPGPAQRRRSPLLQAATHPGDPGAMVPRCFATRVSSAWKAARAQARPPPSMPSVTACAATATRWY